jgi:signal transduction histidine kinase
MFTSARLKLTLWYLLIIFLITSLFSGAFYNVSTREISRAVSRIESMHDEWQQRLGTVPPTPPGAPSLEELKMAQQRILWYLIATNGIILLVSGGLSYFLAGKTLQPIKVMLEEQHQFISNSSHELRTPLATLRAEIEAQLLEKKITDAQARLLLGSNLDEVDKLQKLANKLLQLTKVSSSKQRTPTEVAVATILQKSIQKVRILAKKKNSTITTDLEKGIVLGDADSLEELFVIVLDNAIKYSPEDSAITVTAQKKGKSMVVSVQDNGVGIAASDLDHVFERFYRAKSPRFKTEGFGLGLPIAQQIADAHGGNIAITSVENKGTLVKISLPLAKS